MKVLSFGEILLRLASPGYTKLFQKDSLDATFCGGEANVAVSLANFGVQSEFLTVVPDNDVGHASLNALRYSMIEHFHQLLWLSQQILIGMRCLMA